MLGRALTIILLMVWIGQMVSVTPAAWLKTSEPDYAIWVEVEEVGDLTGTLHQTGQTEGGGLGDRG